MQMIYWELSMNKGIFYSFLFILILFFLSFLLNK